MSSEWALPDDAPVGKARTASLQLHPVYAGSWSLELHPHGPVKVPAGQPWSWPGDGSAPLDIVLEVTGPGFWVLDVELTPPAYGCCSDLYGYADGHGSWVSTGPEVPLDGAAFEVRLGLEPSEGGRGVLAYEVRPTHPWASLGLLRMELAGSRDWTDWFQDPAEAQMSSTSGGATLLGSAPGAAVQGRIEVLLPEAGRNATWVGVATAIGWPFPPFPGQEAFAHQQRVHCASLEVQRRPDGTLVAHDTGSCGGISYDSEARTLPVVPSSQIPLEGEGLVVEPRAGHAKPTTTPVGRDDSGTASSPAAAAPALALALAAAAGFSQARAGRPRPPARRPASRPG